MYEFMLALPISSDSDWNIRLVPNGGSKVDTVVVLLYRPSTAPYGLRDRGPQESLSCRPLHRLQIANLGKVIGCL